MDRIILNLIEKQDKLSNNIINQVNPSYDGIESNIADTNKKDDCIHSYTNPLPKFFDIHTEPSDAKTLHILMTQRRIGVSYLNKKPIFNSLAQIGTFVSFLILSKQRVFQITSKLGFLLKAI